ncbi:MAG: HPr kinase/phosphorylase [Vicinamibacterales bacterium]
MSDALDPHGNPLLIVRRSEDGQQYSFDYGDGTRFLICDRASEVLAHWPDPLTAEDTATYLMGPVFAFVLRLKGRVCLHASSVAVGGNAVAFVGPSGAGKSTLAAALASRGVRVVSEDVLPLRLEDGHVWVDPGGPLIRLWQPSVHSLFGAPDAMPLLTPNWDKRFQPLSARSGNFMPQSCPLRVIYLLGPRQPGQAKAIISALTPREALMALVLNSYSNKLLHNEMRAQEFGLLGQLVAKVPVRALQFGDDFQFLPDVCADLLHDIAQIENSPAIA